MDNSYLPLYANEGKLEEIPLPVLLAYLLEKKSCGMLHLEAQGAKSWIYFIEGLPAGVHSPKSQTFLGAVLREMRLIDDAAYHESLMAMAETKQLQGEILLAMNKITEEQLERALSVQLARKLARLFGQKKGSFHFQADAILPPPMEAIRVNPFALIYNGIKNVYQQDDLKRGLAILVGKACKIADSQKERLTLFDFSAEDELVVAQLDQFRLPQDLARAATVGPTAVMMLLQTMLYCGLLEIVSAKRAVPLAPSAPPVAAKKKPPAQPRSAPTQKAAPAAKARIPAALQRELERKSQQIQAGDPWQLLDLNRGASAPEIKKSFLLLAKKFHPDLFTDVGDAAFQQQVQGVFAALNEAQALLSDAGQRARIEREDAADHGSADRHPAEARIEFERALIALRRRDLAGATEGFRRAANLDATNGDYAAYRIWVEYLCLDAAERKKQGTQIKDMFISLSKAHQKSFYALRFLAAVCKETGDSENYFKALRLAYRLNPDDIEVSRELRLFRIRQEKEKNGGWIKKKLSRK